MSAGIGTVATHLSGERDQALATATTAAAATAPGLLIDSDPLDGPPAQAVTASGSGALLLVVGSHGSGAFAAMTLGSVSRYAATHASCPVVVVRDETTATRRLVAVGIRSPLDCGAALAFAFEEAHLREAALLAVHAWQFGDSDAAERAAVELDELLDDWRCKYPGVDASRDVVHGHPGRVLADLSATGRPGGAGQAQRERPAGARPGTGHPSRDQPRARPCRHRSAPGFLITASRARVRVAVGSGRSDYRR